MKALVKAPPGARHLAGRRADAGDRPNDLLIRIHKTAICGTDLHIYDWDAWAQRTIPVPMTTGHEFMGVVEAVGSHVAGFAPGDRVSGEGHVTCGHCRNCRAGKRHLCRNTVGLGVNRTGCFAEYLSLPAVNAFKLPDRIPDEIAAFLDPLGNATHTALSFRPGRRGRPHHRGGADRHHGGRDRAPRRRPLHRRDRRQRLSVGAGAQDGRHTGHQCHA